MQLVLMLLEQMSLEGMNQ